jgi:hypothetical protein
MLSNMRKRDWLGAALLTISVVLLVADVKTWLNAILIPIAAILAVLIYLDIRRDKRAKPATTGAVTIRGMRSTLTVPGGATVDISPLEMAVDWTKIMKVEPLTIVKAQYGVADNWRDVTEIVQGRVTNYRLDVLVGNEPFDPMDEIAPNRGKYLKIDYRINSTELVRDEWQEGQRAILPKPTK